jgi:PAS domain-containing protein
MSPAYESTRLTLDDAPVEAPGSQEALALVSASGSVEDWNPGAQRLTGIDPAEALGRRLWHCLGAPELELAFAPEPNRSAEGRSSSGPLVRGPEPNRSAEGRSSSGPLVRGPEPNRSAEGRSSSGPLVRGLGPNRSAEGRSSSGPLVRGPELVEAAAMQGARREGKRRLRRGR